MIPDVTRRHMAVNIRMFVLQAHSLDELVELGTLTTQAARCLPRVRGVVYAACPRWRLEGGLEAGSLRSSAIR